MRTNPAKGRYDSAHSSYDKALVNARKNAGDLGPNGQRIYDPTTGTLIREQSADGSPGWRIDADHVNWWDWSGSKRGAGEVMVTSFSLQSSLVFILDIRATRRGNCELP